MESFTPEVRILGSAAELAREAAKVFVNRMDEALRGRGVFTVALSGGSTPRGLYSLLASEESFRSRVVWEQIHFFWGDERPVPPDHPESNYRLADEAMLSRVPVPPDHIHRLAGENPDPARAAEQYEEVLRRFFRIGRGEFPRLDLILLGMGRDGHTASLFPGTEALREKDRLVVANWVPQLKTRRITMTLPVLNQAKWVLFLVSGEEKAKTLPAVLEEEGEAEALPSRLIRPVNGKVMWLVDRSAAGLLKKKNRGE